MTAVIMAFFMTVCFVLGLRLGSKLKDAPTIPAKKGICAGKSRDKSREEEKFARDIQNLMNYDGTVQE